MIAVAVLPTQKSHTLTHSQKLYYAVLIPPLCRAVLLYLFTPELCRDPFFRDSLLVGEELDRVLSFALEGPAQRIRAQLLPVALSLKMIHCSPIASTLDQ